MANDADVAKLESIQRLGKFAVIGAVVMVVIWWVTKNPLFVWPRTILWVGASFLSLMEGLTMQKMGVKASNAWISAAIYLGVAVVPFLRQM